jgi:methoxymalonate biosynthesis acyl carrier protein
MSVTTSPDQPSGAVRTDEIRSELTRFLEAKTRKPVTADLDLFASGTISSLFAMELVVYLEQTFGIVIAGRELKMDNFRTVAAMAALVARLRLVGAGDSDG